ncbi:MAG: hypothetical protein Q7T76_16585, partial [Ferruginibacter sp.]|nr:hypothetical protein [Ferruginibacter sp.]
TSSTGGELGGGTVYKIRPSVSNELEVGKSFQAAESEPLYSNFIQASADYIDNNTDCNDANAANSSRRT